MTYDSFPTHIEPSDDSSDSLDFDNYPKLQDFKSSNLTLEQQSRCHQCKRVHPGTHTLLIIF